MSKSVMMHYRLLQILLQIPDYWSTMSPGARQFRTENRNHDFFLTYVCFFRSGGSVVARNLNMA